MRASGTDSTRDIRISRGGAGGDSSDQCTLGCLPKGDSSDQGTQGMRVVTHKNGMRVVTHRTNVHLAVCQRVTHQNDSAN